MERTVVISCAGGLIDYRINAPKDDSQATLERRYHPEETAWELIDVFESASDAMHYLMVQFGWV